MSAATQIPTASRKAVKERDGGRCLRCGMASSHWHHRRSRSVRDEHTHHPGNGASLCGKCHDWVHANPRGATKEGYIVSRFVSFPCCIPVLTYFGAAWLDCDGGCGSNIIARRPRPSATPRARR